MRREMDKNTKTPDSIPRVFVLVVITVGILLGIAGFVMGFWLKGVALEGTSGCALTGINDGSLPPVPPEPTRPSN